MGLFSKNKNLDDSNDFFDKLKKDLENLNSSNATLTDFTEIKSSHTLTAEEVSGLKDKRDSGDNKQSPLDLLKFKVENRTAEQETVKEVSIKTVKEEKEKLEKLKQENGFEEIKMTKSEAEDTLNTLLDRCSAYTKDDYGNDFSKDTEPIYKLKTVAEILKNDSIKALDDLSKKYDVKIEETQKEKKPEEKEKEKFTITLQNKNESGKEKSGLLKYLNTETETAKENETEKDLTKHLPDISDIDNIQKIEIKEENVSKECTVRFTPIKNIGESTSEIKVSSITRNINIPEAYDISSSSGNEAYENKSSYSDGFDDYVPTNPTSTQKEIKALLVKNAVKKRNGFISALISALATAFVSCFAVSPLSDLMVGGKKVFIICFAVYIINLIANIDIVSSLKNIFKYNCSQDISAFVLSLFTSSMGVSQIIIKNTVYLKSAYYMLIISSLVLFTRSVMKFKKYSASLNDLRQLCTKSKKNALVLINDPSVTYAMAKESIDGDVLLAATRKTDSVTDYSKYFEYTSVFGGKISLYQAIVLVISLLSLIGSEIFYKNIVASLFCSCAVLSFFSLPTLFFINVLPLSGVNKKLKAEGAMICGMQGAKELENANAVALSTADIFPEGTVVLKDIKVLSDNNIDDLLLRAASLSEALNSTLAPVFKQIIKTNNNYTVPDSDTVKYEERLGISGYVKDELLLIGNRKLMESHGIEVPSFEVDKKILKNGCFPIYLAYMQKTCALIIVKYIPSLSIAKKLRKITDSGVTVLFSNSDPNINREMICDHFGLYEDSVKIISNAGEHMYRNSTKEIPTCSTPAVFRFKSTALLSIINSASFVKKTNSLISGISLVSTVLLTVYFLYNLFSSSGSFPSALFLLIAELFVTVVTFIIYLFKKP